MAALIAEHQVANLALGLVGSRAFIDSLIEPTTEAKVANVYFAAVRNELLEAWHWRFATKRALLALAADVNGDPQVRSGWGYCYAAPADMLKAQSIWCGDRAPGAGERIPFAKELDDNGTSQLILTDQVAAELIYTRELATVALWPMLFTKAVAARLAVYMAGALPVKPQLIPMLEKGAQQALQVAAAADANEAQADPEADSEFIRER